MEITSVWKMFVNSCSVPGPLSLWDFPCCLTIVGPDTGVLFIFFWVRTDIWQCMDVKWNAFCFSRVPRMSPWSSEGWLASTWGVWACKVCRFLLFVIWRCRRWVPVAGEPYLGHWRTSRPFPSPQWPFPSPQSAQAGGAAWVARTLPSCQTLLSHSAQR